MCKTMIGCPVKTLISCDIVRWISEIEEVVACDDFDTG